MLNSDNHNSSESILIDIAETKGKNYIERKKALDKIKDIKALNYLAFNASDEWIKLEAAIKSENHNALLYLINNTDDEGLKLEASIVLENEEKLAELAIHCKEYYRGSLAIKFISNPKLLENVINNSIHEGLKAEAALKLKDNILIANLARRIHDDWIRYKLAVSISDIDLLVEIAKNSRDKRVQQMAYERFDEIINEIHLDSNYIEYEE